LFTHHAASNGWCLDFGQAKRSQSESVRLVKEYQRSITSKQSERDYKGNAVVATSMKESRKQARKHSNRYQISVVKLPAQLELISLCKHHERENTT
jgi:hypothetical protein